MFSWIKHWFNVSAEVVEEDSLLGKIGKIVYLNSDTKTVIINLGKDDGISDRAIYTFSLPNRTQEIIDPGTKEVLDHLSPYVRVMGLVQQRSSYGYLEGYLQNTVQVGDEVHLIDIREIRYY